MEKVRKLIVALAATIMALASIASVSATTIVTGIHYPGTFNGYGDATSSTVGEPHYVLNGTNSKTIYCGNSTTRFNASTINSKVEIRQGKFCTNGYRSMTLRPADTGSQDNNHAGAVLVKFIMPKVADNEYHVRFNAYVDDLVYDYKNYAYATINWHMLSEGSSGKASLLYSKNNADGLWTVTTLGTGAEVGGLGTTQTWRRYEATIIASNAENELRFSSKGWDAFTIDEIVVTDKYGRVVLSEDFEYATSNSLHLSRWTFSGDSSACTYRIASDVGTSGGINHTLQVYRRKDTATAGLTYIYTTVPIVAGNTYTLTYDTFSDDGVYYTPVSIDFSGSSVYGTYEVPGSATTGVSKSVNSEGNTELKIAAGDWGRLRIDNIVLRDSSGRIVFSEDFEEHSREFSQPIVKISGIQKYAIDATGTAVVTESIANNDESAFNVYLIAAVYDATGNKLEKYVYDNASISKNTRKDFSLSVPVTSGQKLRLFWWDNISGNIRPVEDYDGTPKKSRDY